MAPNEARKTNNLLELHLKLLEAPDDRSNPEWHVVESYRRNPGRDLRVASSSYTGSRRSINLWLASAIAACIAVATVQLNRMPVDRDVSYKGNAKVFVIIETRHGVSIWDGKTELQTGTKVNTEILTAEDAVAFAAVYDRTSKLLTSERSIVNSKINLKAGVRSHFNNAFELTNENDGEQLVTIVCDKKWFESQSSQNLDKIVAVMKNKSDNSIKQLSPHCGAEQFTLRH